MNVNKMLKKYAFHFVSYLQQHLNDKFNEIDQIILYGSVARGTASKESDIDLFIETAASLQKDIENIRYQFYQSKEYTLFKLKGIHNEINIKTGKLSTWKELHRSITSTGKILWGNYTTTETPIGTKHQILIHWNQIGKSRTAFLNKIYGYTTKKRKIKGLIEQWNGKKIGKSAILIPYKHKEKMFSILQKYEVNAKNIEIFTMDN